MRKSCSSDIRSSSGLVAMLGACSPPRASRPWHPAQLLSKSFFPASVASAETRLVGETGCFAREVWNPDAEVHKSRSAKSRKRLTPEKRMRAFLKRPGDTRVRPSEVDSIGNPQSL